MASVVDQIPFNEYPSVDGGTTVFPYEFQLLDVGDLVVYVNGVEVTSGFVISGVGVQSGGNVTFTIAPLTGSSVLLVRLIALARDTDYQYNGDLREATLDRDFNRIWQVLQGLRAELGGVLRAPYPEQVIPLPPAAVRANKTLGFDVNGAPTVLTPVEGSAASILALLADPAAGVGTPVYAKRFGTTPGPVADYVKAGYHINKFSVSHADYGVLDSTQYDFTGAPDPIIGNASYNDNTTHVGTGNSDHHHSYQSDPHYSANATINVLSGFWNQHDVNAGVVLEATGVKINNPTGIGGTVNAMIGVLISSLTRGLSNWGLFVTGPTDSFFGGKVWLGSAAAPQAKISYSPNLGHLLLEPRPGYNVKIGGAAGDKKLRFGTADEDANDAFIENAGDGRFKIKPRTGYSVLLDGDVEVSGALTASGPLVTPGYTVATLPSASVFTRGRAYVSDATANTFNTVVAGGGANKVPVFSDGAAWRIG